MNLSNRKPSSSIAASIFTVALALTTQMSFAQGLKMLSLNPPGSKAGTTVPSGINATPSVVGSYIAASTGKRVGFLYSAGKYTVINPATTDKSSGANGINDSGTIVGAYLTSDNRYHGFLYSAGTYTTYDETTTESCGIGGINSVGNFVGNVGNSGEPTRGFVNIGGRRLSFMPVGRTRPMPTALTPPTKS